MKNRLQASEHNKWRDGKRVKLWPLNFWMRPQIGGTLPRKSALNMTLSRSRPPGHTNTGLHLFNVKTEPKRLVPRHVLLCFVLALFSICGHRFTDEPRVTMNEQKCSNNRMSISLTKWPRRWSWIGKKWSTHTRGPHRSTKSTTLHGSVLSGMYRKTKETSLSLPSSCRPGKATRPALKREHISPKDVLNAALSGFLSVSMMFCFSGFGWILLNINLVGPARSSDSVSRCNRSEWERWLNGTNDDEEEGRGGGIKIEFKEMFAGTTAAAGRHVIDTGEQFRT